LSAKSPFGEEAVYEVIITGGGDPMDRAERRGELIKQLEDALTLAEELQDATTGFLIERALDEARSQQFKPKR
jgi:hypothetical protein